MGSITSKISYFFYKYFLAAIFLSVEIPLLYLGYLDVAGESVSVFSTVAVIWTVLTALVIRESFKTDKKEYF